MECLLMDVLTICQNLSESENGQYHTNCGGQRPSFIQDFLVVLANLMNEIVFAREQHVDLREPGNWLICSLY